MDTLYNRGEGGYIQADSMTVYYVSLQELFLSRQFLKSLDVHFYVVLLTASGKQQIRPSLLNMELPLEQKDLDYQ